MCIYNYIHHFPGRPIDIPMSDQPGIIFIAKLACPVVAAAQTDWFIGDCANVPFLLRD